MKRQSFGVIQNYTDTKRQDNHILLRMSFGVIQKIHMVKNYE